MVGGRIGGVDWLDGFYVLFKNHPFDHENINRLLLFVMSAINIPLAVFHSVSVGTSLLGRDIFIMM